MKEKFIIVYKLKKTPARLIWFRKTLSCDQWDEGQQTRKAPAAVSCLVSSPRTLGAVPHKLEACEGSKLWNNTYAWKD